MHMIMPWFLHVSQEGVARFGMAGKVRVLLRDINSDLVAAWNDPQAFGADKYKEDVQVSRRHTRGYCSDLV